MESEGNQEGVPPNPPNPSQDSKVGVEKILAGILLLVVFYYFVLCPFLLWMLRYQGYRIFELAYQKDELRVSWAREADNDVCDARARYISWSAAGVCLCLLGIICFLTLCICICIS